MDLTPSAQTVYPTQWALVTEAAAHRDATGGYTYQVTDLISAAAQLARDSGTSLTFQESAGLSSLFGIARAMERAADALTAASDAQPITDSHVSEPPWSRPLSVQTAAPMWQLRAEITYRAPDGSIVTTWGTGIFHNVLPQSVGALRDEATLQFQRMLSKRSEQRNTGGELLSIGRQFLMAV